MSCDFFDHTDLYAFSRYLSSLESESDRVRALASFKDMWVVDYARTVVRLAEPLLENARHMSRPVQIFWPIHASKFENSPDEE